MAFSKRIFPVRAVNNLDDMGIISQLPSDVQAELGRLEDTGFHHREGLRDLFFQGGFARYKLGAEIITVQMN